MVQYIVNDETNKIWRVEWKQTHIPFNQTRLETTRDSVSITVDCNIHNFILFGIMWIFFLLILFWSFSHENKNKKLSIWWSFYGISKTDGMWERSTLPTMTLNRFLSAIGNFWMLHWHYNPDRCMRARRTSQQQQQQPKSGMVQFYWEVLVVLIKLQLTSIEISVALKHIMLMHRRK